MRIYRYILIPVLLAAMLLSGCSANKHDPRNDMTSEEAALYTAVEYLFPKEQNESEKDYLTVEIFGWSFSDMPGAMRNHILAYCRNGGTKYIDLSFEELKEEGHITPGNGDYYTDEDLTYAQGRGKYISLEKSGDESTGELVIKYTCYIAESERNGYDIILKQYKSGWKVEKVANSWIDALDNQTDATPNPDEASAPSPDSPQK